MAKGLNINGTDWDLKAFLLNERTTAQMKLLFEAIMREAARIAATIKPKDGPFKFSHYPQLRDRVNTLFEKFTQSQLKVIGSSTREMWELSNQKNDLLTSHVAMRFGLIKDQMRGFGEANKQALTSFQKRRVDGLNLSDRVWNISNQARLEMESLIGDEMGKGTSAMSARKLLNRFTNAEGAQFMNPGRGVYRSSLKNAERLIRTENNMAYRTADHSRWAQMDFIVGIEVRISNNPNHCPMCVALAGKYPKQFKFVGWHPNCRCHAVPIMMSPDEFSQYQLLQLNEEDTSTVNSTNTVTSMPANFTDWLAKNKAKIESASTTPYFIRDNFKDGNIDKGLSIEVKKLSVSRTPDKIADYQTSLGITIDKSIFELLAKNTPLSLESGSGAYYDANTNTVHIPIDRRRKNSSWKAESVVYHEYGHALDWQHGIKDFPEVKELMDKYRKKYAEDNNSLFKSIDEKIDNLGYFSATKGWYNIMEKSGAAHDTLMSLNYNFGRGHSVAYFQQQGFSEAEFLAHMFENKFAGNEVFKKIMPDLYEDMITLADTILEKIKPL